MAKKNKARTIRDNILDAANSDQSRNFSVIPAMKNMKNVQPSRKNVQHGYRKRREQEKQVGAIDWDKFTSIPPKFMGTGIDLQTTDKALPPSFTFGNAFKTDGVDSFVSLGDISEVATAETFSISFWMDATAGDACVIGKSTNQNAFRTEVLKFTDDTLYFVICNGTTGNNITIPYSSYNGVRTHIVAVYDGSLTGNTNRAKLYINGVLQSPSTSGTIPATTSSVTAWEIGNNSGFGIGLGEAEYNEVSFFSGALTQADATELYNNGDGYNADELTSGTMPFAYYKCNENDGALTLSDEIGNYDGTILNAETPPAYFVSWE